MSRVVLLSQLPSLIDQCAALADGVGARFSVSAPAAGGWQDAVLVLIGADVQELPIGITAPTVLVAVGSFPEVWAQAARLGVMHVAVLPDAAEWLSQRIIEAFEPPQSPALTVGVVAGCGGAGASVLASMLAAYGANHNLETVLIDGDPLGGGVDLVLGAEDIPGIRWPELAESRGGVRPSTLVETLPRTGRLALLSWDRKAPVEVGPEIFATVVAAAQQAFDFVAIDLPRHAPLSAVQLCHHIVLITPAQVRAALAAARVAHKITSVHPSVKLVVREIAKNGLDSELVASTLGLPLSGLLKHDRGVAARVDRGEGMSAGRLGAAGLCADLLESWFAELAA